ncbi:MAG: ATP-dependent Clp protease proteolytic subunit [Campylobacterota bacterium]|nr:ATP-dependent Clp protease proteolytic subunit [Campylobacterota bacterium]
MIIEKKASPSKDDKIDAQYHTLFKKKIAAKDIQVTSDTYKKQKEYVQYRIFVDSFMEKNGGLHEMYNELWDAPNDSKLELRINSRGGLVNEGSQFYSIIKNKFNNRTTTILDSCGYSMGALTFCMGDKRVVTPRSDLMFHDYSGGVGGKGGEIETRIKHSSKHLRKFFKDVILSKKFLSKKEFNEMLIGKDFWFNHIEMLKRGIATHILVDGVEVTAKKYLKSIKKKAKKKNEKL